MIIIKKSTFEEQTSIMHQIYEHIFAKNGAVLNIWFSRARIVSSMLVVDFPLFSRLERKQFHPPFGRVKNAKEPWIKFQAIIYNVLKLRFENPFHGRKSPDIPLLQLRSFRWFDAFSLIYLVKSYPCKYIILRVLTGNLIGKPDTLSLNMPLDILSLEQASYAGYSLVG